MTECDKRMRDAQGETCEIEGMCVCEGREMSVFLCLCMHLLSSTCGLHADTRPRVCVCVCRLCPLHTSLPCARVCVHQSRLNSAVCSHSICVCTSTS